MNSLVGSNLKTLKHRNFDPQVTCSDVLRSSMGHTQEHRAEAESERHKKKAKRAELWTKRNPFSAVDKLETLPRFKNRFLSEWWDGGGFRKWDLRIVLCRGNESWVIVHGEVEISQKKVYKSISSSFYYGTTFIFGLKTQAMKKMMRGRSWVWRTQRENTWWRWMFEKITKNSYEKGFFWHKEKIQKIQLEMMWCWRRKPFWHWSMQKNSFCENFFCS